jgi:hypothetical protein
MGQVRTETLKQLLMRGVAEMGTISCGMIATLLGIVVQ